MDSAKRAKMTKRIVFGAIMIGVLAAILYWDLRLEKWASPEVPLNPGSVSGSWFASKERLVYLPVAVLIALISVLGFLELRRMASATGARMLAVSGIAGTVFFATSPYWTNNIGSAYPSSFFYWIKVVQIVPLAISLAFAEQMIRRRTQDAFRDLAATVLGVAYVGGVAAAILYLRTVGLPALILFLLAAKFTDIGAYFTGSFFGKHKLIPWLSPGKSWEGLAGGLAVAAGICALFVFVGNPEGHETLAPAWLGGPEPLAWWTAWMFLPLKPWQGAIFGAVVGLVGQFADLCESLLKRSANLKDSGALVPEFGGVLDMIDSLLLSAPVAAILLAIMA
jgi:phosphatidate cytidylyltransferase